MYKIDPNTNRIESLKRRTFAELGFKERQHLQEWIANLPNALGEDFLIIQKEFDGFNDTNERLDLLALDREGNIVVIENKLDDTGRDVTWQALKYASYCATLSKEQIRNIFQTYLDKSENGGDAKELIAEFFDEEYEEISINVGNTQRIILIAANFRKEVTSTVLWLLNYKLRLQCFKAVPFSMGENIFLTLEQIIPTKDTEDFMISMADKNQNEVSTKEYSKNRHIVRRRFWTQLLPKLAGKTPIFQNTSPTKDHWLSAGGTNIQNVRYNLVATNKYCAVQLEFGRPRKEENKLLFDRLKEFENEINNEFEEPVNWRRLDDKISSRITLQKEHVNIFNEEDWPRMQDFLVRNIIKLQKCTEQPLIKIKPYLMEFLNSHGSEEEL